MSFVSMLLCLKTLLCLKNQFLAIEENLAVGGWVEKVEASQESA